MSSRTMTGWLLVLGPIGLMACWIIWRGVIGFPDSGDHAAMVAGISANAEATKWLLGLAMLFVFLLIGGLAGLRSSMAGGSGSDYATLGVLIIAMSATFNLGEIAATIAAADVGAAGNGAVAMTIYLAGNGIGATSSAGMMLGIAILGYGVYTQKNFHTIIAALLIVAGIFGLVMALYDYGSSLMGIGYLGISLGVAAMGSATLRSAD
ncbi:uncharacterized protein METZ01_LOCUS446442 [marine metagenome]|uniref:Uncharacterized protein n=1 Tax=marine metagenome TaxID=408172 RepID=A0A382ZFW9_9ZZZZ